MREQLRKLSVLLVSLLCVTSCGLNEAIYRASHSAFFSMSPREREAAIGGYPLTTQLDLYLEGMRLEPPDLAVRDRVASNGKKIVPIVVQRLEEGKSSNREALFQLLVVISDHYCYLGGNQELLAKLDRIASSTPNEREREKAEESVQKIAIRNYPLDRQLTLLLDSNDGWGDWDVVNSVASRGADVVPFALGRLKEAKSDEARLHLFDFLWNVSMHDCSVSKDAAVIDTLRESADSMKDPDARRRAYLWIKKIEHDCLESKIATPKSSCLQ